jgi:hypoxanthine-DNA glycosylase
VRIRSFPPIERANARVLILGTMPGAVSLRERQYYAHPRNAFWRIVSTIFGFDPESAYEVRTLSLAGSKVALWDVLKSCTRDGSLDSDIESATIVPNDIAGFLARHSRIRRVCFNGARAEALYMKHVQPRLRGRSDIEYLRLPSTSPAHAGLAYLEKLRAWRAVDDALRMTRRNDRGE